MSNTINISVIAISDNSYSRGIMTALLLGASAVQIGIGFLRLPEAEITKSWPNAIGNTNPEDTVTSRVFSVTLEKNVMNIQMMQIHHKRLILLHIQYNETSLKLGVKMLKN